MQLKFLTTAYIRTFTVLHTYVIVYFCVLCVCVCVCVCVYCVYCVSCVYVCCVYCVHSVYFVPLSGGQDCMQEEPRSTDKTLPQSRTGETAQLPQGK